MDTTWLEDFLALVDHANFSRAAESRHVTQPAFSRRIRMLEEWVGASLVDRGTHQIALTAAGERFRSVADETLRRLLLGRQQTREVANSETATLRFASTNALSLTFFPAWLRAIETDDPIGAINLVADNMQGCEQLMLQGQANFLLCHHHPSATTKLDPQAFVSTTLGHDVLVPVSAPDAEKRPLHALPGREDRPVPFLAYSEPSGLGRILAASHAVDGQPMWLETIFTSHVVMVLKTMARGGRGVAWSPRSLVEEDLANGHLVRAGNESWDIRVEVRLFRPRSRQNPAAEAFWRRVTATASG